LVKLKAQTIKQTKEGDMLGLTCIPGKIYLFLYSFKHRFRCSQARHFMLSYLLALRLYGAEANNSQEVSMFKLKQQFTADLFQEQAIHIEQKWKRKLDKYRLAA
jgi:hypothetical protein